MNLMTVTVQIEQLSWQEGSQLDSLKQKKEAKRYILDTYQKLVYCDNQQQKVEVKWYSDTKRVELQYGKQRLVLIENKATQNQYYTPYGAFLIEIVTEQITVSENQLSVKYEVLQGENMTVQHELRLMWQE